MTVMKLAGCALLAALLACSSDDDGGPPAIDAPQTAPIEACSDIVATGLNSANIDTFVAMYDGRACTSPLAGGFSGNLHECGYGAPLTVCGQSSGLSQFGCACEGTALHCSNGEQIKAGQERLCGDAGVD